MRYVSTRGRSTPLRFEDVVIAGLADDGGLFLPESIPDVRADLDSWRGLGFVDLAARVMAHFIDDIDPGVVAGLLRQSYAEFDAPDIVPMRKLDDIYVLELFHGPTLAFKDIALQFLGNVFNYMLEKRGSSMNIVGSTSGDTGSAAIAGVRGKNAISIFVMYPDGRTSRLQELQMTSVLDPNVHCIAIQGSFDECQAIMKEIFNDLPFKTQHRLGAVNSVNWARLLAQIVYYVYATLALDDGGRKRVSFSVPTGNFGDIFAGYLALKMGSADRPADLRDERERHSVGVLQHRLVSTRSRSPDDQPVDGHSGCEQLRTLPLSANGSRQRAPCAPSWTRLLRTAKRSSTMRRR